MNVYYLLVISARRTSATAHTYYTILVPLAVPNCSEMSRTRGKGGGGRGDFCPASFFRRFTVHYTERSADERASIGGDDTGLCSRRWRGGVNKSHSKVRRNRHGRARKPQHSLALDREPYEAVQDRDGANHVETVMRGQFPPSPGITQPGRKLMLSARLRTSHGRSRPNCSSFLFRFGQSASGHYEDGVTASLSPLSLCSPQLLPARRQPALRSGRALGDAATVSSLSKRPRGSKVTCLPVSGAGAQLAEETNARARAPYCLSNLVRHSLSELLCFSRVVVSLGCEDRCLHLCKCPSRLLLLQSVGAAPSRSFPAVRPPALCPSLELAAWNGTI